MLRLYPQTCFWNNEILTPIQKNAMAGPGAIAFKKLKILLDRMMLRRTKVKHPAASPSARRLIHLIFRYNVQMTWDCHLAP